MTTSEEAGSLLVDESLAPRVMRGFLRWQLRQPSMIVLLSLTGGFIALSVVIAVTANPAVAWAGLALPVLLGASIVVSWRTTRSAVRRAYPVGFVAAACLTDDALHVTSALGTSEILMSAFRRVDTAGDALVVNLGSSAGGTAIMPRALLSEEDIARLRAAVAG